MTLLDVPVELLIEDSCYVGKFDVIYCSNVIEHIAGYNFELSEVSSHLLPDGVYIQITPPSGNA